MSIFRGKTVAFTLSEILITLGVIGVVSAITMPIIHSKIQKHVLKNQFKKTYSILSQAIQKSYADLGYLPMCSYISDDTGTYKTTQINANDCKILHEQIIKNLKVIKTCNGNALTGGCIKDIKGNTTYNNLDHNQSKIDNSYAIVLNNNAIFEFYGSNLATYPIYLMDINGKKGPNKWGYDVFSFIMNNYKLQCYNRFIENGGTKCSEMF